MAFPAPTDRACPPESGFRLRYCRYHSVTMRLEFSGDLTRSRTLSCHEPVRLRASEQNPVEWELIEGLRRHRPRRVEIWPWQRPYAFESDTAQPMADHDLQP